MFLNLLTLLLLIAQLAIALPNSVAMQSTSASTGSTPNDPSTGNTLLGVNCRGSGACPGCRDIDAIKGYMDKVGDTDSWAEGQQIVCAQCAINLKDPDHSGGLCAFAQKMGGKPIFGFMAKEKLNGLIAHGCNGCGSNPTSETGNNVNDGELTVNYVSHTCGEGVCSY